jgi:hypothetical protein
VPTAHRRNRNLNRPTETIDPSAFEETLRSRCQELRQHALGGPGRSAPPQASLRACYRSAADLARPGQLEMLKLIVNTLACLAAYPNDVETRWPAHTPPSLLKQPARTVNRNEQRRLRSKLAALGFTPVHLCGQRLAEEIERNSRAAGAAGRRTVHWRCASWSG